LSKAKELKGPIDRCLPELWATDTALDDDNSIRYRRTRIPQALDNAQLPGAHGCLRPIAHAQLLQDAAHIVLDRALG
jgi:hypothetical protein